MGAFRRLPCAGLATAAAAVAGYAEAQSPKRQVFFFGGGRWQKGRWGDEEFSVWMMGLNDRMMG